MRPRVAHGISSRSIHTYCLLLLPSHTTARQAGSTLVSSFPTSPIHPSSIRESRRTILSSHLTFCFTSSSSGKSATFIHYFRTYYLLATTVSTFTTNFLRLRSNSVVALLYFALLPPSLMIRTEPKDDGDDDITQRLFLFNPLFLCV
jgi:hypothetical protein